MSRQEPGGIPELAWQLWFEQLKQVAWLAAAAAGGTLILLERGLIASGRGLGIALVAFGVAATLAVIGQTKLVQNLTAGRTIDRSVKAYLHVAMALLGAGAGALISQALRAI